MKYYLRKFFLIFVYLVSSGIIGAGALSMNASEWIKLILLVLNLALFVFIYCGIAFKDGEKALKVRISNDKMRELIVLTGDDYKLDLEGEFKVRKGFITGALACIPLAFFLLIDLLIARENNVAVMAIQIFYMAFYGFFNLDFLDVHEVPLYSSHYWALISVPILIILQGVFFYMGGKKVEREQKRFKNRHNDLFGE